MLAAIRRGTFGSVADGYVSADGIDRGHGEEGGHGGPAAWRTAGPGLAACATAQPIAGRTAPVSAS